MEEMTTDMEKLKQLIEGRIAATPDTNEGSSRRRAFEDVLDMMGGL